MVSIINTNNGIKEPIRRYQNYNISQILIFDGYVKVKESLNVQIDFWINTILNHINTSVDYRNIKNLACYINPNDIKNKNTIKYPYPIGNKKKGIKSSL